MKSSETGEVAGLQQDYIGKRAFDLLVASALIVVTAPILLLAAILIAWECRENPIFVQLRHGRRGGFKLYKLRTLSSDTESVPSHLLNKPTHLPSGPFIRRWKIDELPQLFNVLAGKMSMVGPRPCLVSQIELIAERKKRDLAEFKPGITGTGQLSGYDMSKPELLAQADAEYVSSISFKRDVQLILRTAFGQGRGDAIRR